MGRKTNSIGLRLKKTNKDYNHCWYSDCLYNYHFSKSLKVEGFFEATFKTINVSCPKISYIGAYKKSTLLVCYLDANRKTFLFDRTLNQNGLSFRGLKTGKNSKALGFEFLKNKPWRLGQGALAPNSDIFWKAIPEENFHNRVKTGFINLNSAWSLQRIKKTKLKRKGLCPLGLSFYNSNRDGKATKGLKEWGLVKDLNTISQELLGPFVKGERTSLVKGLAPLATSIALAMLAKCSKHVACSRAKAQKVFATLHSTCYGSYARPKANTCIFPTKEKIEKPLGCGLKDLATVDTNFFLNFLPNKNKQKHPESVPYLRRVPSIAIEQTPPFDKIFKISNSSNFHGGIPNFELKGLRPTTDLLTPHHNSIFFETKKEEGAKAFWACSGRFLSTKIEKDQSIFWALFLSLWLYGIKKKSLRIGPSKAYPAALCRAMQALQGASLEKGKGQAPYGSKTMQCWPFPLFDNPKVQENKPFYNLCAPNFNFFLGLEKCLSNFCRNNVSTHFYKTTNEKSSALFLAHTVSYLLERKVLFRSIKRLLLQFLNKKINPRKFAFKGQALQRKITGIRISCSGRVGGRSKKAQRARKETFMWGETGLHVFSSFLDFAKTHAETPFGLIGVKVWVCTK